MVFQIIFFFLAFVFLNVGTVLYRFGVIPSVTIYLAVAVLLIAAKKIKLEYLKNYYFVFYGVFGVVFFVLGMIGPSSH